jgi:hypothetical protein
MKDWRYYYYEKGTARYNRIKSDWKRAGLKDDGNDVMKIFRETNECQICDIPLTESKKVVYNKKVMNHCHETGYFNNILCWSCNIHEHLKGDKFNQIVDKNLNRYAEEDCVTYSPEDPTG